MLAPPRIPELPAVTHAQFFVLETLMVCPLTAEDLRDELEAFNWLRTDQTFDQLTNGLAELGYVRRFHIARIGGVFTLEEPHYEITVAGMRAYHAAHAFYSNGSEDLAS